MPSIYEIFDDPVSRDSTPIHDALSQGLDVLSGSQTVSFQPYVRTVLPIDGFVFWLNANLLTPQQLALVKLVSAAPVVVSGSLHYESTGLQSEDETIVVRRVDFTAEQQITAFAEIAPEVLYVGSWQTELGAFKFTFSHRGSYYATAKLHHYSGDAVYPAFDNLLIDNLDGFDRRQIASNSLPLWLAMFRPSFQFPSLITTVNLPIYPSYLVPDNLPPPYGAVEIPVTSMRALQSAPYIERDGTRWQLVAEQVRLHLYGLRNQDVLNLIDYVMGYSVLTEKFGIMNEPIAQDEIRTQVELAATAAKKMVEFQISYYQATTRDLARQLIKDCVLDPVYPGDHPIRFPPAPLIGPPVNFS